ERSQFKTYENKTQFFLLGFSSNPKIQSIIFVGLLLIYSLSVLGNLVIICATFVDQKLHIPMYMFLSSLAVTDICFMSSTVPKLLASLGAHNGYISQYNCLLQYFFYYSFGGTEFCSLALLSIDRYLAVCQPLRYNAIMTRHVCIRLIVGSWIFGFLECIPPLHAISQLQFCSRPSLIAHFFCDGAAILNVSCTDTRLAGVIVFATASFAIFSSLIPTLYSYSYILSAIFRISSSSGRIKTFSTCSSHLLVVSITYGSCIFIYVRPAGALSTSLDMTVAVFNSILSPVLNPFIYTLRNQMIKKTLKYFYITKTANLWPVNCVLYIKKRESFTEAAVYVDSICDLHFLLRACCTIMGGIFFLLSWGAHKESGTEDKSMLVESHPQGKSCRHGTHERDQHPHKRPIPVVVHFLQDLSIVDICFLSSTVPRLLASLATHNGHISLSSCLLQFFFYYSFGAIEFGSLAVLSIDRYLAICHPLRYSAVMTRHVCSRVILGVWIFGFLKFLPTFIFLLKLKFCGRPTIIKHFFCDGSALLNVSCSDTRLVGYIFLWTTIFGIVVSIIPTLLSYSFILSSIFKIATSSGRKKTFSTCSAHLLVVSMVYGSCIFIYIRPAGSTSSTLEMIVAVINSILNPLLNPYIYTLRNQMIKNTVKGLWLQKTGNTR
ncbi:olfactory receptor 6F1-like, partial [Pelobates cultripes]